MKERDTIFRCISLRGCVRPSVGRSVTLLFWLTKNEQRSKLTGKPSEINRNSNYPRPLAKFPSRQNGLRIVPRWPIQTHRCPNGLVQDDRKGIREAILKEPAFCNRSFRSAISASSVPSSSFSFSFGSKLIFSLTLSRIAASSTDNFSKSSFIVSTRSRRAYQEEEKDDWCRIEDSSSDNFSTSSFIVFTRSRRACLGSSQVEVIPDHPAPHVLRHSSSRATVDLLPYLRWTFNSFNP